MNKEFCIGVCSNSGVSYKYDTEDRERVEKHKWWSQSSGVFAFVDGQTVSLAKFILGITQKGTKVLRKNKDTFDFRKENLFYRNVFYDRGAHYEVECFDGRTFLIDKDKYADVSKHVWHIDKNMYVIAKNENGKIIKLHRYLMELSSDDRNEVDHINRNTLDNRIRNLRLADRSLNCFNRGRSKYNTSGATGVYKMHGYGNKWCAQINYAGKRHYLGSFNSVTDALNARKQAEQKYYQ